MINSVVINRFYCETASQSIMDRRKVMDFKKGLGLTLKTMTCRFWGDYFTDWIINKQQDLMAEPIKTTRVAIKVATCCSLTI